MQKHADKDTPTKMSGTLENVNPVVRGKLKERDTREEEEDDNFHDFIDAREVFGSFIVQ